MNQSVKRHNDEGLGWQSNKGIHVRNYNHYDAYMLKQATKLDNRPGWCQVRSDELRDALRVRLQDNEIEAGLSVLCLGARLGGEVQAFIDIGCFAIGLDLNPGQGSLYVVHGDFHQLQYADKSIDLIYTNSFDHCLKPVILLREIHRVLKDNGRLMLESKAGSDEPEVKSMGSDHWDSCECDSVEILSQFIQDNGFKIEKAYQVKKSKATPFGFIFRKIS